MLLLLLAPIGPALAQQKDIDTTDAQQGRELAFGRSKGNCLACHQIEGGDLAGSIGPPLVQMKARYPDRDKLFARIWDETQFNSMTVMPPFGRNKILEKQEIQKIVDFLYTL
jgi:sulfur-oxidizing protein SoxX